MGESRKINIKNRGGYYFDDTTSNTNPGQDKILVYERPIQNVFIHFHFNVP